VIGFGAAGAGAAAGAAPNRASRDDGASPAGGLVPKSSSREPGASPAAGFAGAPAGGAGVWISVPSM
jgi:hypothetical protein